MLGLLGILILALADIFLRRVRLNSSTLSLSRLNRIEDQDFTAPPLETQRVSLLVDNMPFGVVEWDSDFVVRRWSGQAERIFGYTEADVVGKRIDHTKLVYQEDWESVHLTMSKLLSGNATSVINQSRNNTKDQRVIHCVWFNSVILDDSGRMKAVLSFVQDRTDQHHRSQALAESERRFRGLFQQAPFGIMIVSPEDKIIGINDSMKALFGVTLADLADYHLMTDAQLIQQGLLPCFQRAFAGESVVLPAIYYDPRITLPHLQRHDDPARWISGVVYPSMNDRGEVCEIVVVVQDISARTNAEIALRNSEQQLSTMADAIPQLVWNSTADGRLSWCNRRWHDFTGVTSENLRDSWEKVLDPSLGQEVTARIRSHFAKGEPWEETVRLRRRDGEYRWHLNRAIPVRNDAGQITNWFGTATDITESLETEERLKLAVDVAGMGLLSIDYVTDTTTPDLKAAGIFGLPSNEPVPRRFINSLFHPDDQPELFKNIKRALDPAGPGTFEMEHRIIRSDDALRWLNVGKYIRFHDDRPVAGVLAAVDVTDRKLAEIAVARSEADYRSLFEMAGMANAEAELDTCKLIRVNRRFCELLGYSKDELLGKTFLEITHPEDRQQNLEAFEQCLQTGEKSLQLEKRYLRKDGTSVWTSITVTFFGDSDGRPKRVMANALDITAQKEAENRIRESEMRFRNFMDNSPAFAFIKDSSGRFVYVNPPCANLVKLPASEWIGKRDHDIFPAHIANRFRTNDRLVLDHQRPEQILEMFDDEEGRRYFLAFKFPMNSLNGEKLLAGLAIDVTKQYRAEQELIEADKRKNQFLATLAHELRNPLAPIRNAVHILKMKDLSDPQMLWVKSMLDRQVSQMSRLLDDLIDVSRISRQRLELRKSRVRLSEVIESAIETSRPLIDAEGHTFSLCLPDDEIYLNGDFVRLAQIFSNLLNNAAKYTPHGGRIELIVKQEGDDVAVSIKDNGIGIASNILKQIFEIFWQGTNTLHPSGGGLGIGLSLVKGLVELHNGMVEAHSDGPGTGSEFIVHLPTLQKTVAPQTLPDANDSFTLRAPVRKILVVDDNKDSADSMALQLQLKGHRIETAYDGENGLVLADEFHPDFILLDIGLPGISGHDVARSIRKQAWGTQPVLIAMTGWGQYEDRTKSKDAGFDYHWTKPVDPDALDRLLVQ